jgi:hypothetical protein
MLNGHNNAIVKRVPQNLSTSIGEYDIQTISTWNLALIMEIVLCPRRIFPYLWVMSVIMVQ